eukprot:594837-Rhodomonas_salina.4
MAEQPLELELETTGSQTRGGTPLASSTFRSLSHLPMAGGHLDSTSGMDSDSSGWLASDEARSPAADSFVLQTVIHEEPELSDEGSLHTPAETPRSGA